MPFISIFFNFLSRRKNGDFSDSRFPLSVTKISVHCTKPVKRQIPASISSTKLKFKLCHALLRGISKSSIFSFTADRACSGKRILFTMFSNGDRGLSLLALIGYPADLVSVQLFVQANTDNTGTGIADRYHMLISTDFAQLFLCLVSPRDC